MSTSARRWNRSGVSRREIGAGVVAAVAALVASLVALPILRSDLLGQSADVQYWVGYVPQFATLAGLVVGTVVWRGVVSPASTPRRGALAGVVTALGTVVLVPVLVGLYVVLFPVFLGVVTGQEWLFVVQDARNLRFAVGWAGAVAVGWTPLVGVILVPLGALAGWAYQRYRSGKRR